MGIEGVHHAFAIHFYGDITKVQLDDQLKSFPKSVSSARHPGIVQAKAQTRFPLTSLMTQPTPIWKVSEDGAINVAF